MIIELNDDETRLLYSVLLEQAQEHFSYASTSEVAKCLYKLASRFGRPVKNKLNNCVSTKLTTDHLGCERSGQGTRLVRGSDD